jgi:hypothetical protein
VQDGGRICSIRSELSHYFRRIPGVRITDHSNTQLPFLILFQEPIQIRLLVVIIEKTLKKTHIRTLVRQLIAVIFAVPYKKSSLERIDDEGISAGRSDIEKLLCSSSSWYSSI